MLISVIVPTRNRVGDLLRALKAIAEQTYPHFECIVVDDGSNEATRTAHTQLWSQLDSRFRLVLVGAAGQRGTGPSFIRNLGIESATGEVIAFCDDDDFWCAPNHLSTVAQTFERQPEVDMFIGNQRAVSVDGSVKPDWLPLLCNRVKRRTPDALGIHLVSIEDLCAAGGFPQLNTVVVRRHVIQQINGFWLRTSFEEDRDFFWRSLDVCRLIAFSPQVIAQHNSPDRSKKDNLSTNHDLVERWLFAILVCEHIGAFVLKSAIIKNTAAYKGDLLRKLALYYSEVNQRAKAYSFARQALGSRFSWKWLVFVMWLRFKSLFDN